LLGLVATVLGLGKDEAQVKLEPFQAAVAGRLPVTHWHRVKLRKDPPNRLPNSINSSKAPQKTIRKEAAALILQEWLFNPEYTVWISLPENYHGDFVNRLRERRWHFQPCLGLSEMMADIWFLGSSQARKLPFGRYEVATVMRQKDIRLDIGRVLDQKLALNILRMPRSVTPDRVFSHDAYVFEKDGRGIPLESATAHQVDEEVIMFL
jgi:CRISPR-associated protein Cas5h